MKASPGEPGLTPAEYLAIDRAAEIKSEFRDGEMLSLADATEAHTLIRTNLWADLSMQLRGRPWRLYSSDMRLKVGATGLYAYPDIVVVCREEEYEDECHDTLLNPTLLVEVLSPETEAFERGEKFARYRRLDSLQEFIIIAQHLQSVERYLRQSNGWMLTPVSQGTVPLPSIGCELALAEVYDKIELPEDSGPKGRGPRREG